MYSIPGLRRLQAGLFEHVLAIVDHLEIAIDHQQLGLAADLLAEVTEVRGNVIEVELRVFLHVRRQILEQPRRIEFHAPAGGKYANVDRVRARRPVVLDLREDLSERHFGNDDLGSRRGFELLAALRKAPGDDIARAGKDVDGDPVELAGHRDARKSAES